jgi:hypothetical protein
MFQPNDIIMNFKRYLIYPYSTEETNQYNKDMFSCRLASLHELKRYNEFIETSKTLIIKFKDLGFNKKNTFKKSININLNVSNSQLLLLNNIIKENEFCSYNEVFFYVLNKLNYCKNDYLTKQDNERLISFEKREKQLIDLINNLNKLLINK